MPLSEGFLVPRNQLKRGGKKKKKGKEKLKTAPL
jgi:hypothetical protein